MYTLPTKPEVLKALKLLVFRWNELSSTRMVVCFVMLGSREIYNKAFKALTFGNCCVELQDRQMELLILKRKNVLLSYHPYDFRGICY